MNSEPKATNLALRDHANPVQLLQELQTSVIIARLSEERLQARLSSRQIWNPDQLDRARARELLLSDRSGSITYHHNAFNAQTRQMRPPNYRFRCFNTNLYPDHSVYELVQRSTQQATIQIPALSALDYRLKVVPQFGQQAPTRSEGEVETATSYSDTAILAIGVVITDHSQRPLWNWDPAHSYLLQWWVLDAQNIGSLSEAFEFPVPIHPAMKQDLCSRMRDVLIPIRRAFATAHSLPFSKSRFYMRLVTV